MKRNVNMVIVHQSASNNLSHDDIEIIRKWHIERGFLDVGYHYFIRKDGSIEHGRSENMIGAHCKGHNKSSIGICLSGKGEKTKEQLDALEWLLIDICSRFNLGKKDILGHNDLAQTECPGFDLHQWLSSRSWH